MYGKYRALVIARLLKFMKLTNAALENADLTNTHLTGTTTPDGIKYT